MASNQWDARYQEGRTGWNIGTISTPLKDYIDGLADKSLKILIPGCGNAYEAEYLFRQGFAQVYVADISKYPLDNFQKRVPDFPKNHLLHTDFFKLTDSFDLILEQTFFCALPPKYRSAYVDKIHQLLNPEGKLAGLLFDFPKTNAGPPDGGDRHEYRKLFKPTFTFKTLDTAYNSIKPRAGKELFFIAHKA